MNRFHRYKFVSILAIMHIKQIVTVLFLPLILLSAGCSYKTAVGVPYGVGVHSSYEEKVPGRFAIFIMADKTSLDRKVSPSSYICSAHSFPVEFHRSFEAGVIKTSEDIFQQAYGERGQQAGGQLMRKGYSGYVLINLKHFEPKISFVPSMFTSTAQASADIGISFTVKDMQGNIMMAGVANASRSVDGDSGAACAGGATLLVDAISKATRQVLEEYAEKVSNSQKLRSSLQVTK